MTPAERMELDLLKLHQKEQHSTGYTVPTTIESAAALIRRLAPALAYALDNMPMDQYLQLKKRHADALRDVGVGS